MNSMIRVGNDEASAIGVAKGIVDITNACSIREGSVLVEIIKAYTASVAINGITITDCNLEHKDVTHE